MAGLKDISSVWKNIKEVDLKPIRDSATYPVRIAIVGVQGAGRHSLAEQMRTDPARPGVHSQSPVALISTEAAEAPVAHLIIILVDATRTDFSEEQSLAKKWSEAGKNVLVFINKIDLVNSNIVGDAQQGWIASRVIYGSVNDIAYMQREFIPVVLELLPQQHLALGRQFPLFRIPIARQLINETCLSNAAYSFSTGLAEIVPVLDIPLNLTDMVVLTKTQAFLAYKLGLLLGFSTRWQDYVKEFGGVIGGGFMWRQIARELVGLIPGWGIVPKVAISYSGTYVVGNAILSWYLTGRNLSPKQMRALYSQAFASGKEYARKLAERIPRPRLGKRKRDTLPPPQIQPELAEGEVLIDRKNSPLLEESSQSNAEIQAAQTTLQTELSPEKGEGIGRTITGKGRPSKRRLIDWRKKKEKSTQASTRICLQCGKTSSADASFCQYCGTPFGSQTG